MILLQDGWSALYNNGNQWIMADLHQMKYVGSITTQGRQDAEQWVTSYTLCYGSDSITFQCIQDINNEDRIFVGNSDRNTKVTHLLPARTHGRYIKLHVISWYFHISIRWGLTAM